MTTNTAGDTAPADMTPPMRLALSASFGSVEEWRAQVVAAGADPAAAGGELRLTFLPTNGTLVNRLARDTGSADADPGAEGIVILVVPLPPGRSTAEVAADVDAIDWSTPYERYQHAVHRASESFAVAPGELEDAMVLDVRRKGAFDEASDIIPGSHWQDPVSVTDWVPTLPRDHPVVVYCVFGHEVGRATALRLRAEGIAAGFLRGGIEGWRTDGLPLEEKGSSQGGSPAQG